MPEREHKQPLSDQEALKAAYNTLDERMRLRQLQERKLGDPEMVKRGVMEDMYHLHRVLGNVLDGQEIPLKESGEHVVFDLREERRDGQD